MEYLANVEFRAARLLKGFQFRHYIEYLPCEAVPWKLSFEYNIGIRTYLKQIGKEKLRYDVYISCWLTVMSTASNIATGKRDSYRLLPFGNRAPGKTFNIRQDDRNKNLLPAAERAVLTLSVLPPTLATSDKIGAHFIRTVKQSNKGWT